jgi:phage gp29-like protein
MDVKEEIADSDTKLVVKSINQLIQWIDEFNWNSGIRPTFNMWQKEDIDQNLADRDAKLYAIGWRPTEKYLQKEYGFAPDDFTLAPDTVIASAAKQSPPFAFSNSSLLPSPSSHASAGEYPDQLALDSFIENLSPDELQKQAEGLLKPIIDLIENATSFEEILNNLAATYPNMDNKALEQMLSRALYVAELHGRLSAQQEATS